MGSAAEDAVLKQLKHRDPVARYACQVLKEIGTKKSIPALKDLARRGAGNTDGMSCPRGPGGAGGAAHPRRARGA